MPVFAYYQYIVTFVFQIELNAMQILQIHQPQWSCSPEALGLLSVSQRQAEFYRITNKNLLDNFRAAINLHTPGLLRLYRARRPAIPSEMDQLLKGLDEEVINLVISVFWKMLTVVLQEIMGFFYCKIYKAKIINTKFPI